MPVLSLPYEESDVTKLTITNISQSLHHDGKTAGNRYGMRKLRHCHPMYTSLCLHVGLYANWNCKSNRYHQENACDSKLLILLHSYLFFFSFVAYF